MDLKRQKAEEYATFMMTDGNGCAWPIGHLETEVDFEVVGNIYDNNKLIQNEKDKS